MILGRFFDKFWKLFSHQLFLILVYFLKEPFSFCDAFSIFAAMHVDARANPRVRFLRQPCESTAMAGGSTAGGG